METSLDDLAHNVLGSRGLTLDELGQDYILCFYFVMTIFATGARPQSPAHALRPSAARPAHLLSAADARMRVHNANAQRRRARVTVASSRCRQHASRANSPCPDITRM